MKKAYVSYRYTGEDIQDLKKIMEAATLGLKEAGVDPYCSLLDPKLDTWSKGFGPDDFIRKALKDIKERDVLVVVMHSREKSEGMLMEVGVALALGLPIVVAVKRGVVNTYLPKIANRTVQWSSQDELRRQLEGLNFDNIAP